METTVQSGAGHQQVSGQWVVMRVMGWLSGITGMGGYWLGLQYMVLGWDYMVLGSVSYDDHSLGYGWALNVGVGYIFFYWIC